MILQFKEQSVPIDLYIPNRMKYMKIMKHNLHKRICLVTSPIITFWNHHHWIKQNILKKWHLENQTEIIELMKETLKKIFDPLLMKQIIQKDNYLLRKNYLSRLSMTGIIVCVQ